MKLVTKASMITALNDPRDGFQVQYIGKALVAIFKNQTEDEKSANTVNNHNNIGFASCDARDGGITAKYFIKHGTLLEWQVENWMKDWRGAPRITKYHRQLNDTAVAKSTIDHPPARVDGKGDHQPIFTHDQAVDFKHVFVGNTVGGEDVYFSVKFSEVIIRFGDLEPEYRAMDLYSARQLPKYQEAVNMVNRIL